MTPDERQAWRREQEAKPKPKPVLKKKPTAKQIMANVGFTGQPAEGHRTVSFTRASDIVPRPTHWIWQERIAQGTLALLAGREGIGKSGIAYDLAASVTRGELPGVFFGKPKTVIIVATEDSWEQTIVPRLMAAKADLEKVLRVDVATSDGVSTALSLPQDLRGLEKLAIEEDCGLILLDPLISRLSSKLDTHKDAEVRIALEPLVALADKTRAAMIGLIHVNKGSTSDPLNSIMGSRAFTAVARTVMFAMKDPENEMRRYLGFPKVNLGRGDLPSIGYTIENAFIAETEEGSITASRIVWGDETQQSISELLETTADSSDARSATAEAAAWLNDYLVSVGRKSASAKIIEEARRVGHSGASVRRARERLNLRIESTGFPRQTFWSLP
jgi:hypothetical protein